METIVLIHKFNCIKEFDTSPEYKLKAKYIY